jgi:starch synthase
MNILMVAAENDALEGGKVGGIGDVVRDIPVALAASGHQLQVISPGYQSFSHRPGATRKGQFTVTFAGQAETIEVYTVPVKASLTASQPATVTQWVLEHPLFAAGGVGKIYCDDPANRPFATDASKFALFSIAVAKAVVDDYFGALDVLHLHDWHAAMVAVLRAYAPSFKALQSIHTVYTIHNLALQGVRPLAGDESSLQGWFHGLNYEASSLNDPRAPHCINSMRAGINLSDKVHAVSPTYAGEIKRPSNAEQGFFGGEGLEKDLQRAADEGRLQGILNGCEYPDVQRSVLLPTQLLSLCESELMKWVGKSPQVSSAHWLAGRRISEWQLALSATDPKAAKPFIATSVGRITNQKVLLLQQTMADGRTALDHLLAALGDQGLFILLGSGDTALEQFLTSAAANHRNLLFLQGYSEALSEQLYSTGDLFVMPSSFEPCGISQMLAMRAGQPCLVHSVGGLRDTVIDGKTGFAFNGETLQQQAQNMIQCFSSSLELHSQQSKSWARIAKAAAKARFLWSDVAAEYDRLLYHKKS